MRLFKPYTAGTTVHAPAAMSARAAYTMALSANEFRFKLALIGSKVVVMSPNAGWVVVPGAIALGICPTINEMRLPDQATEPTAAPMWRSRNIRVGSCMN